MKQFSIPKIKDFISWDSINILNDFSYPWREEKAPATVFQAYYDDNYLHFLFVASGSNPLVYVKDNNKMEVVNSERVEIFFRSNEKMQPYYCLEMDPHGRVLDYIANFYREFDYDWQWPEPLSIQTEIGDNNYSVKGQISLSVLNQLGLPSNNQIQLGLFRGHCTKLNGDEASLKWISWVDPKTKEPDFHTPSAFGLLTL